MSESERTTNENEYQLGMEHPIPSGITKERHQMIASNSFLGNTYEEVRKYNIHAVVSSIDEGEVLFFLQ